MNTRSKQTITLALALAGAAAAGCGGHSDTLEASQLEARGNGAPSGAHFNLNFIGVPRGRPGGISTTTTCATDPTTGDLYCSIESMVLVRTSGKQSFTNASRQLLYVQADIDGDGDIDRVPLFDDARSDYYWQYDNQGLHLAQLRFYEIPTKAF